jgi:hypothetical protein
MSPARRTSRERGSRIPRFARCGGRADGARSFYDALRFSNWLNNGQGAADTETGAYTLLGGTAIPSNGSTVTRNGGASIFVTSENEWYKAAYYDAVSTSYFNYPAGTDSPTVCAVPTATANSANCDAGDIDDDGFDADVDHVTIVGSFTGAASPYGTFDQGGNVFEWNEGIVSVSGRALRGGGFADPGSSLAAADQNGNSPSNAFNDVGFRVVRLSEPGRNLLVVAGILALVGFRRARA